MVEIDGEALKALWIALRRQYRAAIAPKAHSSALPSMVKAMPAPQQLITQLAPDSNNTIKIANAIPSPYLFSCLIRTLIWLAPDLRYCRKEHPLLWRLFSDDLVNSWEAISTASAEHQLGDPMQLITELLTQLFARVQLSTMIIEDNNEDSSDDSSSSNFNIFDDNHSSSNLVSKCKLIFEPIYIDLVCKLSIMTLKQVTSPLAVTLLPQIYTAFYAFAFHTGILENANYILDRLLSLLLEVMKVESEAQSSKNVFKRQLYSGLTADAVYFLVPTMALACKVYHTLNLATASISDPFTTALTEINFDKLLHQLRVESISSSEPAKRLSIHLARLIIALSEVFANGSIEVTTQVSQLQRKLAHEVRVLLIEDAQATIGLEDVVALFAPYTLGYTIMSHAAKVVSSFSSSMVSSLLIGATVTNAIQVLGMYNAKYMAFEDIIQTVVFDDELAFDASINAAVDISDNQEIVSNDVFDTAPMPTAAAAASSTFPQIDIIPVDLATKKKDRRPLTEPTPVIAKPAKADSFGDDLFGGFEVLQPTPPSKSTTVTADFSFPPAAFDLTVEKVDDGFGSSAFDSFDSFSAPSKDAPLKVPETLAQPFPTGGGPKIEVDFGVFAARPTSTNATGGTAMNPAVVDPLEIFSSTASKSAVKTNPFKELPPPPAPAKLVALAPPAAGSAASKRGKAGKPPPAKDFLADLLSSPPVTSSMPVGNTNKASSPAFDDRGTGSLKSAHNSGFGQSGGFGGASDPFKSSPAAVFQSTGFGPATADPFGGFPQQPLGQTATSSGWPGSSSSAASDGFASLPPVASNAFYPQSAPSFGQPTSLGAPSQMFLGSSFAAMPPQQLQYQQQQPQTQQLPPKAAPPKNPFDDFN